MQFTEQQIIETMDDTGFGRLDAIRFLERTEADWQDDFEGMLDAYYL